MVEFLHPSPETNLASGFFNFCFVFAVISEMLEMKVNLIEPNTSEIFASNFDQFPHDAAAASSSLNIFDFQPP